MAVSGTTSFAGDYGALAQAVMEKNRQLGQALNQAKGVKLSAQMILEVANLLHDPLARDQKIKECINRFLANVPIITLAAAGIEKKVSAIPLAEHCPVFLARITGLWNASALGTITFSDVTQEALELFEQFINTGRLEETPALEQAQSLFKMAYEWQEVQLIKELSYLVFTHAADFDEDSKKSLLEQAQLYHNLPLILAFTLSENPNFDKLWCFPEQLKLKIDSNDSLALYQRLTQIKRGLYAPSWHLHINRWVNGLETTLQGPQAPEEVTITSAHLSSSGVDTLLECLAQNKNLRKLTLTGIELTKEQCQSLARILKGNKLMESLDLSNCALDTEKLACIGEGWHFHPMLQEVNLSENKIQTLAGSQLGTLTALKILNLSHAGLTGEGLEGLMTHILTLSNLAVLDLSFNDLKELKSQFLTFLRTTTSLTELNLDTCALGTEALIHLFEAIREGKTVSILNLDNNSLNQPQVLESLARFIRTNACVRNLSLSASGLTSREVQNLAEALQHNQEITSIDISQNILDQQAVMALTKTLQTNKTLSVIGLRKAGIKDEIIDPLIKEATHLPNLARVNLAGNPLSESLKAQLRNDSRYLL